MITDIHTQQDFDALLARSATERVLLLKHSTRCPISGSAWREFQRCADAHPERAMYRVLVIEDRPLSAEIARQTGVMHQSPQVLLFGGGRVAWQASHWSITTEALDKAFDGAAGA